MASTKATFLVHMENILAELSYEFSYDLYLHSLDETN